MSNIEEGAQGIIAVLATLTYVFGFAIGLGSVAWVIMSEIVPIRIRTKAFSLFVSINWACNLIIGLLTLTAIDGLGGMHARMLSTANKTTSLSSLFLYHSISLIIITIDYYITLNKYAFDLTPPLP